LGVSGETVVVVVFQEGGPVGDRPLIKVVVSVLLDHLLQVRILGPAHHHITIVLYTWLAIDAGLIGRVLLLVGLVLLFEPPHHHRLLLPAIVPAPFPFIFSEHLVLVGFLLFDVVLCLEVVLLVQVLPTGDPLPLHLVQRSVGLHPHQLAVSTRKEAVRSMELHFVEILLASSYSVVSAKIEGDLFLTIAFPEVEVPVGDVLLVLGVLLD